MITPVKGCGQVDSVVTSKGTVTVRSICSLDARGPAGSGLGARNGAKAEPDPPLKPAGGSGFKPLRPFDSLPLQPAAGSGFKPLRPFDSLPLQPAAGSGFKPLRPFDSLRMHVRVFLQ